MSHNPPVRTNVKRKVSFGPLTSYSVYPNYFAIFPALSFKSLKVSSRLFYIAFRASTYCLCNFVQSTPSMVCMEDNATTTIILPNLWSGVAPPLRMLLIFALLELHG